MTYLEHVQENCVTYSPLRPVTEEENAMLMRLAKAICEMEAIPCTGCNYCMPCPYGLNIPAVFTYYNNCLAEGLTSDRMIGSSDSGFRQMRRQWLVGYDRAVPHLRQADHCIGCNHCIPHCPQRIDIPAQMKRVDEFVEQLKQS
jgi:predicted aldo/keto reductase-like oxidoreductase